MSTVWRLVTPTQRGLGLFRQRAAKTLPGLHIWAVHLACTQQPHILHTTETTRLPGSTISRCITMDHADRSIPKDDSITAEDPVPNEVTSSSVLATVREFRQKYPSCVLLVRVGDFYELYYEQADDIGGHVLGLQVVDKKFRKGSVRFTGFPARSLLRYVEILVARHGLSVAICEQFQEPLKQTFTRKVTRVITPGTLIDDQCLATTRVHNYILSIARLDERAEENRARDERWAREKKETEEKYREQVERTIAAARRDWEDANRLALSPVKRRPGRPRKDESLAAVSNTLEMPAFDPSTVQLPDPPDIPPRPEHLVENSRDEGDAAGGMALGLAWLDLATGDFMTSIGSADTLAGDLARIRPSEILIDEGCALVRSLLDAIQPSTTAISASSRPSITPVASRSFRVSDQTSAKPMPATEMPLDRTQNPNVTWSLSVPNQQLVASPEHLLLEASELSQSEQTAACALLNYIVDTQLGLLPPLQPPVRYQPEGHVRMSASTIQALELLRPLNADRIDAGTSLLKEIDMTKTSAGGRLLAERLAAPSTDIGIIERRLDLVEFFCRSARVRGQINECLDRIGDIERAVNKLSLNCGGPHDLLDISRTLCEVGKIKAVLKEYLVSNVSRQRQTAKHQASSVGSSDRYVEIIKAVARKEMALQALDDLVADIGMKIREDAERDVRAFGFLKPNCSKSVTALHTQLATKEKQRTDLQDVWRIQYKCTSLKLDTISNLGHFIEVSKRESVRLTETEGFRMIQTLKNKVRFENNEWTHLLSEIEMLRNRIQAEEMRVFEELRDSVLAASAAIKTNSKVLADLDVSISMAMLAQSRQYRRPRFVSPDEAREGGLLHTITSGRHPVVESQLLNANRQYIGNDCVFGREEGRVLLLTGPNMGGKSTYLRQIAITSIMGQMGGYVPAESAQLHIIDAVYSRIGAHDNLALDQSTFMVEMSETADILRHATENSLVILDEIGRGTATSDGISIAYATLKYLHDVVGCKAVFATHYHELVPHVVPALGAIVPLQTAVYEDGNGGFAFLHKVKPGICTKSHALYVAQIAGIPKQVLASAREFAEQSLGQHL
ncbi:MutS protein 1 [Coemansia erecta]|uniref:MutS protein 1 n=1 Tax=Coemansia erecta TaxID=147472 RepID=A0A9W7Y3Z8_9FUNG|nr:MutS protein 1 [Coemansia erecta]